MFLPFLLDGVTGVTGVTNLIIKENIEPPRELRRVTGLGAALRLSSRRPS